jgi:hypothetical protein
MSLELRRLKLNLAIRYAVRRRQKKGNEKSNHPHQKMLGITIDRTTNLFGDNQSVVMSATRASSTLKKKHNAITFHRVSESLAAGFVRFAHEPGVTNAADILSKPVPGPRKKA